MRALLSLLICAATYVGECSAFIASHSSPRQPSIIRAGNEEPANSSRVDDDSTVTNTNATGTWNPFSLAVLKLGFTEPAWTSSLNFQKASGRYLCANCGTPLFSSHGKFDSGSGWPSFWKTISSNRVELNREWDGRIECRCQSCRGHLGHVFSDGPQRGSLPSIELASVPETDPKIGYKEQGDCDSSFSRMPRYCINGLALRFEKDSE